MQLLGEKIEEYIYDFVRQKIFDEDTKSINNEA